MKTLESILALALLAGSLLFPLQPQLRPSAPLSLRGASMYGLPLTFEANRGQAPDRAEFVCSATGRPILIDASGAAIAAGSAVVRMTLAGANPAARGEGVDRLPATSNYFSGRDSAHWLTGIPNYAKVRYVGVYPGIDVVYRANQRQLEYDFVVAPGAGPSAIRLEFAGTERAEIDAAGDLVLGSVRLRKPLAYQEVAGRRHAVEAAYLRRGAAFEFQLGPYDRSQPLVIDPMVIYSTEIKFNNDLPGIHSIAVDATGNVYVGGYSSSSYANPIYRIRIAKLGANGELLYSTQLGNDGNGSQTITAVAVDALGNAYVTGYASSAGYPTTPGVFQPACGNPYQCGFLTKLAPDGTLVYSTYAGPGMPVGIAVDARGSAYIAGTTGVAQPATRGAFQEGYQGGRGDGYVMKFNATGTGLVYSTHLGGSGWDGAGSIAVDDSGAAYVAGFTASSDFPLTPGAFQSSGGNSFVLKLNATGSRLVYSALLPISSNQYYGGGIASLAIDAQGSAYLTGNVYSGSLPATPGVFQPQFIGSGYLVKDAFAIKLKPDGSGLAYCTYLGGSGDDYGNSIAVDPSGNAYVVGFTRSVDFPRVNSLALKQSPHGFLAKINADASALFYSTDLEGTSGATLALDRAGNPYILADGVVTKFVDANPAPVIRAVAPASAPAGLGGLTIGVTGANFTTGSVVRFNGADRATNFFNGGVLGASLTAGDLSSARTAGVQVFTPTPGGGASDSLPLVINPAAPAAPAVNAGGAVNGASYAAGAPLARGSIASIFGVNLASSVTFAQTLPLPTELAGVSVQVNGTAAPLFYVSPRQINFQVPWETSGHGRPYVTVTANGVTSGPQAFVLASGAPGIFAIDSSGSGQGAILISGTGILAAPAGAVPGRQTRPARRWQPPDFTGDIVEIYATGLAPYGVPLPPPSGAPAPASPLVMSSSYPRVTIGGVEAAQFWAQFAGLAPGYVGLWQINVLIDGRMPVGDKVPVVIDCYGIPSNTVTMAIQ